MRGSEEYPANLVEFIDWFPSDEACLEYLEAVRWPGGFRCPKCRATSFWSVRGDVLKECATCHHQTSATAGTIFEGTRKSLRLWFLTMWLVTAEKNGISAMGLQRELGFSRYETAWTWLHKLRRAMVRPGRDRLSGLVEMDETYIGGDAEGLSAFGLDVGHRPRCSVLGDIVDRHPGPLSGQSHGNGPTQPRAGAGDERNLVLELHVSSFIALSRAGRRRSETGRGGPAPPSCRPASRPLYPHRRPPYKRPGRPHITASPMRLPGYAIIARASGVQRCRSPHRR